MKYTYRVVYCLFFFLVLTNCLVSVTSAETMTFADLGIASINENKATPTGTFYIESENQKININVNAYFDGSNRKLTIYVNGAPVKAIDGLRGEEQIKATVPPENLKIGQNEIYLEVNFLDSTIYGTSTINIEDSATPASDGTMTFADLGIASINENKATPTGTFYIESENQKININVNAYFDGSNRKLTIYVNGAPVKAIDGLRGEEQIKATVPPENLKIGQNEIYLEVNFLDSTIYGTSTIRLETEVNNIAQTSVEQSNSIDSHNSYVDSPQTTETPEVTSQETNTEEETQYPTLQSEDQNSKQETSTEEETQYPTLQSEDQDSEQETNTEEETSYSTLELENQDEEQGILIDESSSENAFPFSGALLLLLLVGSIVIAKKINYKKPGNTVPASVNKSDIKNKKQHSEKISPASVIDTQINVKSAFSYKGATIQYKVKVENQTSEPIGDVKVNLYVPEVFILSESTRSIPIIKSSESKTVTFEIRPTNECGDCQVSGKIVYYDYKNNKNTETTIPSKNLSIVCPILRSKEITESEWRNTLKGLTKAEETTKDIDIPSPTLFDIVSDVLQDMGLFMLEPKINDSGNLYRAVSKFYGEGVKSLKYAAQIEVVGSPTKSKIILKAWAQSEESLTGFYHGILDEIEKRVHVKGLINTAVINNYHYGDNIGTQVKDSVVQRSSIGTSDSKCPGCGKKIAIGDKFCMSCGNALD